MESKKLTPQEWAEIQADHRLVHLLASDRIVDHIAALDAEIAALEIRLELATRLAEDADKHRTQAMQRATELEAEITTLKEPRAEQDRVLRAGLGLSPFLDLKPSGQAAEDAATAHNALQILGKRTGLSYRNAADALSRLATKAQGYEAATQEIEAQRTAIEHCAETTQHLVETLKPNGETILEAAQRAVAERDAAVADDAAWRIAALAVAPAIAVLARAPEVAPDIRSVLLEAEAAFLVNAKTPHPGAALLERMRSIAADIAYAEALSIWGDAVRAKQVADAVMKKTNP